MINHNLLDEKVREMNDTLHDSMSLHACTCVNPQFGECHVLREDRRLSLWLGEHVSVTIFGDEGDTCIVTGTFARMEPETPNLELQLPPFEVKGIAHPGGLLRCAYHPVDMITNSCIVLTVRAAK